ncbi:hypothetical protein AC792_08625 [Arthrobacter sp. RIT-PI-e]|uniref:hypothetical protein n=1 Tax=Arthrobacter sp. RIT-PI-e TaxID=1681197 RepID=UPI00067631A2|nr:hypothetical protein [Arthrobacter sp. RIT-PI-e]KNC19030.1 hypothetical protein AC792_08625 [Arthrobacter sp. RIT-PI-e]
MLNDEEDYLTPAYLLWICVSLGSIITILGAGALINALITADVDLPAFAGLGLLIFLGFFLVRTAVPMIRDTPRESGKD